MNTTLEEREALQTSLGRPLAPECLFCGEAEVAEVFEVFGPREFMLDTCCHGMHEAVTDFLNDDPKAAGQWLGRTGLNELMRGVPGCGGGVRRVIESGGQLILDWNLTVAPVDWATAKEFVHDHHRHCKRPAGWRFGAGVMNGSDLLGVVVVGRPVARMLDQKRIVEVNRLCIRQDLPQGLEWNACSLLYGWAAREAKRRGFERIITYTLASEPGTTLTAAGWTAESYTPGRRWSSPSRPRGDNTPTEDKVRWCRTLVKSPTSRLTSRAVPQALLARLGGRFKALDGASQDRPPIPSLLQPEAPTCKQAGLRVASVSEHLTFAPAGR